MRPPAIPLRWSRAHSPVRDERTEAGREAAQERASDDRQPYAELAPLLGWDRIPELMRVLDE
jgi:hypothetical protein